MRANAAHSSTSGALNRTWHHAPRPRVAVRSGTLQARRSWAKVPLRIGSSEPVRPSPAGFGRHARRVPGDSRIAADGRSANSWSGGRNLFGRSSGYASWDRRSNGHPAERAVPARVASAGRQEGFLHQDRPIAQRNSAGAPCPELRRLHFLAALARDWDGLCLIHPESHGVRREQGRLPTIRAMTAEAARASVASR